MSFTSTLHRAVQQQPNAIMTSYLGRRRTFAEVYDRVGRLAAGLHGLGMEYGDRVAILALNSDDYSDYLLAVAWAGGVVNPQNIRWSAAEIGFALEDSGTKILFVDETFAPMADALLGSVGCLETLIRIGDAPAGVLTMDQLIADHEPVADAMVPDADMIGLFYTGGTTGTPKGVMLSTINLTISALGSLSTGQFLRADSIYLHVAPMFHLADLAAWFSVCMMGGSHVMLPKFDAPAVLQCIEDYSVTDMLLVPAMIQMLVDDPSREKYNPESLQGIVYGASPIAEDVLKRAMAAFPNVGFTQAYGMTELSPVATLLTRDDHVDAPGRPAKRRSAGRAAPHSTVRIVGPEGNVLPPGEVGEIVVQGGHVMLGYWNRPEETASAKQADGMHTGDAGYMDDEGYVFVVDRIKDMIITGGENVYSAEVENALASHHAVATCAVIGLPDDRWGERVHAVVVLQAGAETTPEILTDHVRTLIAGYKVPRGYSFVDALPMSGAGKVLKRTIRDEMTSADG